MKKLTDQEIEEAAIASALNMGASDCLIFPDMTEEEFSELDKLLKKLAANKALDELSEETERLGLKFTSEEALDKNKDLMDDLAKDD